VPPVALVRGALLPKLATREIRGVPPVALVRGAFLTPLPNAVPK